MADFRFSLLRLYRSLFWGIIAKALMANKLDLAHLRTVRIEQHTTFAKENAMSSHFVCAKNGDQISLAFRRIVGIVTGIEMSKEETQRDAQVVKAGIVQYPAPKVANLTLSRKEAKKEKKSSVCTVM